jgi:hypothetical protein
LQSWLRAGWLRSIGKYSYAMYIAHLSSIACWISASWCW